MTLKHVWPNIGVRNTSNPNEEKSGKRPPRRGFGNRKKAHKYDTLAMLRDRISGMSWEQIATKHGISKSPSGTAGTLAYNIALYNGKAYQKLTPDEIRRLEEIGNKPRRTK